MVHNIINDEQQFRTHILWTDEATQDMEYKIKEIPIFSCRKILRQLENKVSNTLCNLWLGIIGNHLGGLYFLSPCLSAEILRNFLNNYVHGLLKRVNLETRRNF